MGLSAHTREHTTTGGAIERRLIVLGSTGSVGTQTLDVVRHINGLAETGQSEVRLRIVGLAAGNNHRLLLQQAREFGVQDVAIASPPVESLDAGLRVRVGPDSAECLVRDVKSDLVLAAMVGSAGLPATLAAVQLGRDVVLANKETLVSAGELVVPTARLSGSRLLPVDSEHGAIWECLQAHRGQGPGTEPHCPPMQCGDEVSRIVLTASGGPFRTWPREAVMNATPQQALNHPTWRMGQKVTIDSASLTNKALEVVEAHWLFGLPAEKIDVLVHPQSVVHGMVEFAGGSVIAHMAAPDMRTPIQYALTFPRRPVGNSHKLDFAALRQLDFHPPDLERFPALSGAYEVIRSGGTAGAVFNAANEKAVEAFLAGQIPFGRICELSLGALRTLSGSHTGRSSSLLSLADALEADAEARRYVDLAIGAGVAARE